MSTKKITVKKVKPKKIVVEREIKDVQFPLTFTLHGAGVSVNHLYSNFRGRVFLKPEGKRFKLEGAKYICDQLGFDYTVNDKTKEITVIHGIKKQKYKVTYTVFSRWLTKSGDILKSDVSNRAKISEDTVSHALGVDDKYFFDVQLIKIHDLENPRFEITIDIFNPQK